MKKLIMDDFSLLGNALALAAKKAPTLESLAAELNVRQEDLSLCWFADAKAACCPSPSRRLRRGRPTFDPFRATGTPPLGV